jgi:hypothetical protein
MALSIRSASKPESARWPEPTPDGAHCVGATGEHLRISECLTRYLESNSSEFGPCRPDRCWPKSEIRRALSGFSPTEGLKLLALIPTEHHISVLSRVLAELEGRTEPFFRADLAAQQRLTDRWRKLRGVRLGDIRPAPPEDAQGSSTAPMEAAEWSPDFTVGELDLIEQLQTNRPLVRQRLIRDAIQSLSKVGEQAIFLRLMYQMQQCLAPILGDRVRDSTIGVLMSVRDDLDDDILRIVRTLRDSGGRKLVMVPRALDSGSCGVLGLEEELDPVRLARWRPVDKALIEAKVQAWRSLNRAYGLVADPSSQATDPFFVGRRVSLSPDEQEALRAAAMTYVSHARDLGDPVHHPDESKLRFDWEEPFRTALGELRFGSEGESQLGDQEIDGILATHREAELSMVKIVWSAWLNIKSGGQQGLPCSELFPSQKKHLLELHSDLRRLQEALATQDTTYRIFDLAKAANRMQTEVVRELCTAFLAEANQRG